MLLLTSGCSQHSVAPSFVLENINNDQAGVYIYRPAVMANALYAPHIRVNDEDKGEIKNGDLLFFRLPASTVGFALEGRYTDTTNKRLVLQLKPGEYYYLRVDSMLRLNVDSNYEPYQRRFSLHHIAEKPAQNEILHCCIQQHPADQKSAPAQSRENRPENHGFSVDKTQNPFSH